MKRGGFASEGRAFVRVPRTTRRRRGGARPYRDSIFEGKAGKIEEFAVGRHPLWRGWTGWRSRKELRPSIYLQKTQSALLDPVCKISGK